MIRSHCSCSQPGKVPHAALSSPRILPGTVWTRESHRCCERHQGGRPAGAYSCWRLRSSYSSHLLLLAVIHVRSKNQGRISFSFSPTIWDMAKCKWYEIRPHCSESNIISVPCQKPTRAYTYSKHRSNGTRGNALHRCLRRRGCLCAFTM